MNRQRRIAERILEDENPNALFFDGYDKAIIGIARRINMCVVAYSGKKIIKCLIEQGMNHEEAMEFFDFNVAGSWVGDHTPIILGLIPSKK
jgi:hypothetical protein